MHAHTQAEKARQREKLTPLAKKIPYWPLLETVPPFCEMTIISNHSMPALVSPYSLLLVYLPFPRPAAKARTGSDILETVSE